MANTSGNYIFTSSTATTYYATTAGTGGSGSCIYTTVGSNGTFWSNNTSNVTYTTNSTNQNSMKVKGDLSVDGHITVKGKDLVKLVENIENRLAILQDPDPEKLEKFAALKKAYDHYKLMEKLIGED